METKKGHVRFKEQSSRVWNEKLDRTLKEFGLEKSKTDPCIYYREAGDNRLIVAIYVDDLLILSNKTGEERKDCLRRKFEMKDLGEAKQFLGIDIERTDETGDILILALATACQEALWLRELRSEIEPEKTTKPMLIFSDSSGAVSLSSNMTVSQRSKHIDVRYHFMRDHIERQHIKVEHVNSENMTADCFTKPLPRMKLDLCVKELGMGN